MWRSEGKKPSFLAGFLLLLGNGVLPCSLPDCCVFLIVAVDKEALVSGHLRQTADESMSCFQ